MAIGRTHAALAVFLFAAACNDLSVRVSFEIPSDYADQVRSIKLEILVPPVAEPFDCDDVAFQETSAATVALSSIQEHTLGRRESVELSGIPRLGTKLFLARGFDDQDLAVVAACGAIDEVDGEEELALVAEPSTVVIAPDPGLGVAMPGAITIGVTDGNNRPVEGVEVRGDVTGPAGVPGEGATFSDSRGEAVLRPEPPAAPGPAVLDVRARWARDPPPRLAFFQPTTRAATVELPAIDGDGEALGTRTRVAVGRIGPAGEVGIAAIGALDASLSRPIYVAYFDGSVDPPFQLAITEPVFGAVALGVARGAQRDRVVTLIAGRWVEIHPDGTTTTTLLPGVSGTARAVLPAGPCAAGTDDTLLVAMIDEAAPLAAFTPDGGAATSPFLAAAPSNRLFATGCASDVGGDPRRTAVFSEAGIRQRVLANLGGVRSAEWLTFPDGVGFAPAVGADAAGLLGVRIAIEGTSIARHRVIALGGDALDLDVVAEDESITPSISSDGGDVDADDRLDVVAALDFGRGDDGPQYRVFMALGADADGERLAAVSPVLAGDDPEVFVVDFNEDGVDDVGLVTTESITLWVMGEP